MEISDGPRQIAQNLSRERRSVRYALSFCVDLNVEAGAGDGDIGQTAVNEFCSALAGVHVYEDAVGGLALTA